MQLALGKDLLIKFLNALLQTCPTSVRQVVVLSSLEGRGKPWDRETHTWTLLCDLECFLKFIIKIKPVELH